MKVMQLISPGVSKFWNLLEIRILVLLSLAIQTILTLTGRKRKNSNSDMLSILLWVTYMVADWAVTVSLSVLSNHARSSCGHSLDSNIALTLVSQVVVAAYVLLKAWTNTPLNILAIPVFLSGVVKCGQRVWVLWSASSEKFRESMLSPPDPGPNYARYMEEYSSKKDEGFKVSLEKLIRFPIEVENSYTEPVNNPLDSLEILQYAYGFFATFKLLFADLILSFHDIEKSQSFFMKISSQDAFEVIEVELGFIYDVFYTKAVLKHEYSRENVVITYVLVAGAIILELYAAILLLCSDWMMLSLKKHSLLYQAISSLPFTRSKRWSNTMAQHNLISTCLEYKPASCRFLTKVLCIDALLEKHRYKYSKKVPSKLKKVIFDQLSNKSRSVSDIKECKKFCDGRGYEVLEGAISSVGISDGERETIKESVDKLKVEFDKSILLWHIATDDLCLSSDKQKDLKSVKTPHSTAKEWDSAKKWELICHVWVEMLSYAASHCQWNHHAQQLTQGGELLPHVWLLMAHLGITEQFQISLGHERAKLNVE
ncbi:uncharacterized protein LOC115989864 [Quercus lobata]|uniref:uncharacterized protein LOC115989864 n=1 Tax=Quercus lobata TaxID=97700 RepID=UPI0012450393|nr:uncharacterized protein LOC115989864 [Quercus lobata]